MKETNFTIGAKELTFLAALAGGETLFGLEDPFDGWLAHQVEEEWEKLAPEMEVKLLIKRHSDGEIVVGDNVAEIIKTCCFPSACIISSRWEKGDHTSNSCYYITKEMLVEKVDMGSPNICGLSVLQESSEVAKRLKLIISLSDVKGNSSLGGEVPSSVIETVRTYKQNEHRKALSLFQEKCPAFIEPALLINALIDPSCYTILMISDFQKEPVNTYGFSVLEGQKGTLKMRAFNKGGQEWLEIKSCSKEILDQELAKINKKVKMLFNK